MISLPWVFHNAISSWNGKPIWKENVVITLSGTTDLFLSCLLFPRVWKNWFTIILLILLLVHSPHINLDFCSIAPLFNSCLTWYSIFRASNHYRVSVFSQGLWLSAPYMTVFYSTMTSRSSLGGVILEMYSSMRRNALSFNFPRVALLYYLTTALMAR